MEQKRGLSGPRPQLLQIDGSPTEAYRFEARDLTSLDAFRARWREAREEARKAEMEREEEERRRWLEERKAKAISILKGLTPEERREALDQI